MINREELMFKGIDLYKWIIYAENVKSETQEEYENSRSYYENEQAPDYVPEKFTYVQENLVTDMVNGMVGSFLEGRIGVNLSGGGEMAKPVKELVYDMFERTRFNERCAEPMYNYTYVEGLAGIEFYYNPRRRSQYGLGMPELYIHRPSEILLDPNSKGFLHEDDIVRAMKTQVLRSYAEEKWPDKKDAIGASVKTPNNNETEEFVDLYFIEIKRVEFENKDGIVEEVDRYYWCKIINKDVMVESPRRSGFGRFTILPTIHTPREWSKRDPMGAVYIIKQTQDLLNSVGSLAYEGVKSAISKFYFAKGVTQREADEIQKNITTPGGFAWANSPGANVEILQGSGISRDIVEWYKWKRLSFDEQSGRYAPERGASEQELSGVAIAQLQQRGKTPELTKKTHFQYALSEVVMLFIECAAKKMSEQPFNIERPIEGEKRKLYFNTRREDVPGFKPDEYNVVDKDGIINNLLGVDADEIDVSIDLNMNQNDREAFDANKALMMANMGKLSTIDLFKAIYPVDYKEKYDNMMKEQKAMQIVEMISQNEEMGNQIMSGMGMINEFTNQMQKR